MRSGIPTSALSFNAAICPRVFFFQAEDGIRDRNVTGVQTCALPISDFQRAANLFGDDHPSQVVDPSDYTYGFHTIPPKISAVPCAAWFRESSICQGFLLDRKSVV